jgi:hypothetical protein
LGTGRARLAKHLDAAAAALQGCEEAHVVVEGGGVAKVRAAFDLALVPFEQDLAE